MESLAQKQVRSRVESFLATFRPLPTAKKRRIIRYIEELGVHHTDHGTAERLIIVAIHHLALMAFERSYGARRAS